MKIKIKTTKIIRTDGYSGTLNLGELPSGWVFCNPDHHSWDHAVFTSPSGDKYFLKSGEGVTFSENRGYSTGEHAEVDVEFLPC